MTAPPDELVRHMQPISVSSANCVAVTGMSWRWVVRFARAHGVPVWRVGERKQLVPASLLADAMQRVAASAPELSLDDEVARIEAEIAAELRDVPRATMKATPRR